MENTTNPNMQSTEPVPPHHGHKNWMVLLIFLLVAILIGVLLIFHARWADFDFPVNEINTDGQANNFQSEIDSIDTGDLDAEFLDIEAELNSL